MFHPENRAVRNCLSFLFKIQHLHQCLCAGDTSLNLAAVFPQGAVVAFEMGPPIQMLRLNVRSDEREEMFQHENKTRLSHCRLNPQFKIDVHNVAVSNKTGSVVYHSGSSSRHQVDKVEEMGDLEGDLTQKILRLACSPTTTYQWNSKKQKYFLSQNFSQKLSTLSILNVHLVH